MAEAGTILGDPGDAQGAAAKQFGAVAQGIEGIVAAGQVLLLESQAITAAAGLVEGGVVATGIVLLTEAQPPGVAAIDGTIGIGAVQVAVEGVALLKLS